MKPLTLNGDTLLLVGIILGNLRRNKNGKHFTLSCEKLEKEFYALRQHSEPHVTS